MSSNDDRRNRGAALVLAFAVSLLPAAAAAAEPAEAPEPAETRSTAPAAPEEAPPESASANGATDAAGADDSANETGPGGFVPSEEISEDFAVSFPVDI